MKCRTDSWRPGRSQNPQVFPAAASSTASLQSRAWPQSRVHQDSGKDIRRVPLQSGAGLCDFTGYKSFTLRGDS